MKVTITTFATTFAAMGLLALAGCGSKDASAPGAPKSTEEVKQEAAKLETPEPGEYRQSVEITRLDAPGIPKEAAEQMMTMLKSGQQSTICLTKADAEKGYRDMFKGVGKGDQCTYSKFDVDGGHLDAQMECTSPQQGKATMKLAGTVTKNGSAITIDMDASGGPAPMSSMKMTMHMTTTRLGDCKAS
jgi:predicted small lipoprotein YifL